MALRVVASLFVVTCSTAPFFAQADHECDDSSKTAYCEANVEAWYAKHTELMEELAMVEASMQFCNSTKITTPTPKASTSMGSILFESPSSYTGQKGALIMMETESGLTLKGSFAGLEPSSVSHWHLFTGDCETPGPFVSHFDVPVDSTGFAELDLDIAGLTIDDPTTPIQAVEILEDTGRLACGGVYEAVGVEITGQAKGVLIALAHCPPCHIHLNGALGGLEANATGMVKIHQGYDCQEKGGSYTFASAFDPWANTTFVSDDVGNAQVSVGKEVFTVSGQYPVQGRAVATYDMNYVETGCGVLSTMA